jgi:peptide/nickel transport system substrate-binding protein
MVRTISRRAFLVRGAALTGAAALGSLPTRRPLPAAAAALPGKHGGVLRIGSLAAPAHFDVHQSSTTGNIRPQGPMYDLIVRHNEADGGRTIVPDLAHKWEVSGDGRTYTFFFRDGVKFHDGAPFSAEDAQATMLKIIRPPKDVLSPRQPLFEPVEAIDVVDRLTLRFKLKHSYASFLSALGQGWNVIVRKQTLDANGGDLRKVIAPGTGPFRFKSHKPGQFWVLERNPEYWNKGLPYLDGVEIHHFPPGSPASPALRAQRIDVRELYIFPDDVHALAAEPRIKFERYDGLSANQYEFNLRKKPWSDPRVRTAVDLALNRDALVNVYEPQRLLTIGGYAPPSVSWAIPRDNIVQQPGFRKDKTEDLARARQLMAEAGYGGGLAGVTLVVREGAWSRLGAPFFQDQMKKLLNIGVNIKVSQVAVVYEDVQRGAFDIALGATMNLTIPDPVDWFPKYFKTGVPENRTGYSNPKLDAQVDQLIKAESAASQRQLALELQRILMEDRPIIVEGWNDFQDGYWDSVKNMFFAQPKLGNYDTRIRLDQVWLDR